MDFWESDVNVSPALSLKSLRLRLRLMSAVWSECLGSTEENDRGSIPSVRHDDMMKIKSGLFRSLFEV